MDLSLSVLLTSHLIEIFFSDVICKQIFLFVSFAVNVASPTFFFPSSSLFSLLPI